MLKKKIKIPKTAVPKDLIKLLAHHIPDVPDLNINLISVKGFLMHLKRPELDDLIKRLDQLGLPLPMIHIPKVRFFFILIFFSPIFFLNFFFEFFFMSFFFLIIFR